MKRLFRIPHRHLEITDLYNGLLEIIFPRTCIRCGRLLGTEANGFTCPRCFHRYQWIEEPVCPCCGIPYHGQAGLAGICHACRETPPAFDRSRSLLRYRQTGARLVHVLKYEGGVWLRTEITKLLRCRPDQTAELANTCLIPVPLHPGKRRSRGYNQAEVLARAIRDAVPGVRIADCLKRIRATPSQTFLSREERIRNMKNAFRCRHLPESAGPFVLVDDVLTTGATLNAAATALRQAGLPSISAFTLAHG